MHKLLLPIAVTLLLSACASPSWQQAGVSSHDSHSALSQCKYEVGLNKIPSGKQKELIRNCMEGKGYRYYK